MSFIVIFVIFIIQSNNNNNNNMELFLGFKDFDGKKIDMKLLDCLWKKHFDEKSNSLYQYFYIDSVRKYENDTVKITLKHC